MLLYIHDSESGKRLEMIFDQFIAWVTAFNIREDSMPETIKAFAVMARTEAARRLDIYGGRGCELHKGCHLCTEPGHCLEYGVLDADIPESVYDAVNETKNKIILFEGRPIKPYFHYRCGGATENSENVIGSRITYIRKVLCSYCDGVQDPDDIKYFTVEELEKLLGTKISKPEGSYDRIKGFFEDIEIDEHNRVRAVKVGSRVFKGTELMDMLKLGSTRFNYTPTKFLIKTMGTGHGLGLCQCGADEMAKQGCDYKSILKYYYTGVNILDMEFPEQGKPLKGRKIVLDAAKGGCENDTIGISGLSEKAVNLDIVFKLKGLLEKDGASVTLTRDKDIDVALSDRANISNDIRPDFFLSIGQNSFSNVSASGTEVYHYREDKEGKLLSKLILEEISEKLGTKNRGVREGEYFLLREVKASSILLQLLYITNNKDEARLSDEGWRMEAAEAIYNAITKYYEEIN